ncbi:MAG TPA: MogA/MoaB family molybdenum cofactor biosynthesis protein [Acidimicrobiia bacterium]|nr:MogA/MoaB family molybdenum cofactor biosynthesis protein [Acidimicrobiia bacterium]
MSHTAAVLTVSDGVSYGTRQDASGEALAQLLSEQGFRVVARRVVPDEIDRIAPEIVDLASIARLVVTTGGTGFGPRDVTPEATRQVIEREAAGMAFLMIKTGLEVTPMAALSRGIVGSVGSALVVNLPGSPQGAIENLGALLPVIPHALQLLAGETEHSPPD